MASENSEQRMLRQALSPQKDCLGVERLEQCLHADAPQELRQHVERCAYCRSELELLQSFYTAPRDAAELEAVRQITERLQSPRPIVPAAPRSWWRDLLQARWMGPAALTVAAMLLVTAVGLEWRNTGAPRVYAPDRTEDNTLRSGKLTLLAPTGDQQAVPSRVEWQAVAGASRYQVRMLEIDRSEIWQAATSELQLAIPAEVQSRIVPAKTLVLQVTAMDAAGRTLGESDSVRFRLLQNLHNR